MLSFFKTARENARKAAEYDAVCAALGSEPCYSGEPLSSRVKRILKSRTELAGDNIVLSTKLRISEEEVRKLADKASKHDRSIRNLKQFQPKAAAEKKVDA